MKKICLANRKEYIQRLQKEIENQQRIIQLIESYTPINFEQRIIHEYAIEGSGTIVADKLNAEGHRKDGRKYIGKDISEVVNQKPRDEVHEIARKAFLDNKKKVGYLL